MTRCLGVIIRESSEISEGGVITRVTKYDDSSMHYLARRLGVLEGLGQGRDADADVADGEVVVRAAVVRFNRKT